MEEQEIGVADIGGTHARFAFARVAGGRARELGPATVFRVADFASLDAAWRAFLDRAGRPAPRAAALAVACPVRGDELKFTNNPWRLRPRALADELGVEKVQIVNDFGAVGHAIAQLGRDDFVHVAGPARLFPHPGIVSVIGPGTGLGVALTLLDEGSHRVVEAEGGHAGFAPRDAFEDALLARMQAKYGRVSVERIVSGPGLAEILAEIRAAFPEAAAAPAFADDKSLWAAAISGAEPLARAALDRFFACLGAFVGDVALIHGANAVVLAGGLLPRMPDLLQRSGFAQALAAKGRYATMMANLPIWLLVHPNPGLFGAAAAFAAQHD
ncbi:glucokinase [Rhodoblastus acidophilus]|uniref:Glucokinase n=1 Tax=Candidatus Rhodoblastus alkanivorans TaxID=2954117 RepID=A0ABS9ZB53_9HYPH|nr:glucokinase [Candidatus Rhodoblastus alkanivorans]MCI4679402.1 glucokinase [Candidatus Rhodoblastus alkanivorans]MCI4684878.1 glucokinase [Candidatus Rhodoblastus alkanivorans]MDI4642202.1 glucokinase [Rhodoblastus acidophilus]